MNFNDAAFVSVKRKDCRIHFLYMSKDDAISIMNKSDLIKIDQYRFFFVIYKNEWNNLL